MVESRHGRAEIGLLLLSLLVTFPLLEGAVRIGRHVALPISPRGGYAPIRGKRSRGPRNALGYRDVEHENPKPKGVRRIVFLGDSFTYGVGILLDDTYPRRIVRALSAERRETWEAVVQAVPGDDTQQEADILEAESFAFEPDMVVLGFVLNDAEAPDAAERRRASEWLEREDEKQNPPLWRSSALASFVADRLHATRENRSRVRNHLELYRPEAPGFKKMSAALDRIAVACRLRQVPLLVAIFPLFANSFDDTYPFQPIHDTMANVCESKRIECVDLLPAYRGLDWRLLVVEGANDEHPNELAHRLAADALIRRVESVFQAPPARLKEQDQGLFVPARP